MAAHPGGPGEAAGEDPASKEEPPLRTPKPGAGAILGLVHRVRDEATGDRSRLILTTETGDTAIRWLVDTGAVVSLLSFSVWDTIINKPQLREEKPVIIGATGVGISVKGTSTLITKLGREELEVSVIIRGATIHRGSITIAVHFARYTNRILTACTVKNRG